MTRPVLCAALCVAACINEDARLYQVELRGVVGVAEGDPSGTVHLELYHARTGEGVLETPLRRMDQMTLDGVGAVEWTAYVPLDEGEGLVLYGWLDRDGDDLLCGLGAAPEPAGFVELTSFPEHRIEFALALEAPCAGASALYPP